LDELVAARSVEVLDGNTVRCLSRAYVPRGADVTRIERMGRFLAVVTGNFVHNLLRADEEPIYFERTVVSDELLSDPSRDAFLSVAGEKGQELLAELDTFLTRVTASEQSTSGKRYGVGIYFFEELAANESVGRQSERIQTGVSSAKTTTVEEIDVLAPVRRKE
jgi:hypothetical protein